MLSSTISTSTKPFPSFIKDSCLATEDKCDITKIFPKIGLINGQAEVKVDFDIKSVSVERIIYLAICKFKTEFSRVFKISDLRNTELLKVVTTIYVFDELLRRISKKSGIDTIKSKIVLTYPILSYDKCSIIYRRGTDVFKLTKSLLEQVANYANIPLLNTNDIAKELKNVSIVFSSSDMVGAWDIATMSMRGIKSCMRWESEQAPSLVGSIADPCCGIIYLTNGTRTKYGSKMLFRALVRFMSDKDGKPALLVDRLYSSFYKIKAGECNELDRKVRDLFIDYLKSKSPNCSVVDCLNDRLKLIQYNLFQYNAQQYIDDHEQSYLDTPLLCSDSYIEAVSDLMIKNINKTPNITKQLKPIESAKKLSIKAKTRSLKK